jgi:hypothetical protein
MAETVAQLIAKSIAKARAAVDTIHAKHVSIPSRPAYDRHSLGAIVGAMVSEARNPSDTISIVKHIRRIRMETKDALDGAQVQMTRARIKADEWIAVAEYINGTRADLPPGLDGATEVAAKAIRRGAEGGIVEPREAVALANEIKRDHAAAVRQLEEGSASLARIISAGDCAVANEAAKAIQVRAGTSPMLAKMARHYKATATRRKLDHATKYYDERQQARLFRGIEQAATGVRVEE